MRIITIEVGRAGLLIPPEEILPLRGVHPPDLCNEIAQRYSFVYPPDFSQPITTFQEKGMEFAMGKFHFNGEDHNIERLAILAVGLIVSASSTDVAQEFLKDLLIWGAETHEFRVSPDMFNRTLYLSQIIVEFDESIDNLIRNFEAFTKSYEEMFNLTYKSNMSMHCHSVTVNFDRTTVGGDVSKVGAFAIERRVDEPYELNKFFCQAPLRTEDHIRLIEKIEHLLTGDLGWADA